MGKELNSQYFNKLKNENSSSLTGKIDFQKLSRTNEVYKNLKGQVFNLTKT